MREDRLGRHEGPGGPKPPVTVDDHNRALYEKKRGRHEHPIPIFKSSLCEPGKVWFAPADWNGVTACPSISPYDEFLAGWQGLEMARHYDLISAAEYQRRMRELMEGLPFPDPPGGLEITAEISFDDKPRPGRITGL